MKYIYLLFFFTIFSFSQESKINNVYQVNYQLISDANGNKIVTDFFLLTSGDRSLYLTEKSFEKVNKKRDLTIFKDTTSVKDEVDNIVKIDSKNHLFYVYKNYSKDSLTFTCFANNKSYKINEPQVKFNWLFENEVRMIDSIKCKKATTNFRGRNFTAWYSEDIPIFDGPFKFNGLPGLIIEIYDSEFKYLWNAKSIKINKDLTGIVEPKLNYKVIDIKESVKLTDEKLLKLVKMSQSRLPNGAKSENLIAKRANIEIKYEWE